MMARIVAGLQRTSATTPSRWAEKYRIMNSGNWNFNRFPWLREMHDSTAEKNVGQKSAQMGFTETVLNLTFFHIDVKRVDCLYVLPAKTPDASDFSSGRFDPALELSPHLKDLFSDVQNVGHKRAGSANLYVRGSKSRGGLKSVPVGFIVLDELEEMDQNNIPLALERTSGQLEYQAWLISTPTLPDVGINKEFKATTQENFFFRCPHCSKWTDLSFPECLEITAESKEDPQIEKSFLKCKECSQKLDNATKPEWLADGKWVPTYSDRVVRGFHINQLYSSANATRPANIARSYLAGLENPTEQTEFYNSKLGKTHTVEGAQITDSDIDSHIESYSNGRIRPTGLITMGVDVGKHLHVEIDQWTLGPSHGVDINTDSICRAMYLTKVENFDALDRLMREWGVHACVVDANPERRSALQFANRWFGHVHLCIYAQGIRAKDIVYSKDDNMIVLVDRTSWMDLALSRFRRAEMIGIPADVPFEYRSQLKVPIRVYKKDKDGNPVGYYENRDKDDHYAHARVYSEIALKFAATISVNRDIRSPV